MQLPKNGTIVIVDDKIDEATPLMNALSKVGASFCYYNGKPKYYPDKPLSNVRIVFLDMHLDEIAGGTNGGKNVVSTLMTGLETLICDDNGPYVVMLWSKHDSQHAVEFKTTIMGNDGLNCKPIAILNMEKSMCFETKSIQTESGEATEWILKSNGVELIEKQMQLQLAAVDAFSILYNWEDEIRESAKMVVGDIGTIFEQDSEWNVNIKSFMGKMAKAYAGETITNANEDYLLNFYYSLNGILTGKNDYNAKKFINDVCNISIHTVKSETKGLIELEKNMSGSKYILSQEDNKYYLYKDGKLQHEGKWDKLLKKKYEGDNTIAMLIEPEYSHSKAKINSLFLLRKHYLNDIRPGNIYWSNDNIKNELCNENKISLTDREHIKAIELEVSPICDYSQKKWKRVRVLPGLLVPKDIVFPEKKDAKYTYMSKLVIVDNTIVRMYFDFRYLTSEKIDKYNNKKAICALNDECLQNIKDDLFFHGSRSGMVVVE